MFQCVLNEEPAMDPAECQISSDNIETIEFWCLPQDIDAAYIFDDGMDFETGLSSLLEVPNLDFSNSFDYQPTVTGNSAPTDNTSNMNGNFPFFGIIYVYTCMCPFSTGMSSLTTH